MIMRPSHLLLLGLAVSSQAAILPEQSPSHNPQARALTRDGLGWLKNVRDTLANRRRSGDDSVKEPMTTTPDAPTTLITEPFTPNTVPSGCPPVWLQIKAKLRDLFVTEQQCNALARSAIRAVFHDCGTWDATQDPHSGGCDGSLFVGTSPDCELVRPENRGMDAVAGVLLGLAKEYAVSVADMIVFADAATVLCPGGPTVQTFIGRFDNTTSAPTDKLPSPVAPPQDLVALFAAKGLDATELAALLGAHSTAVQQFFDPSRANASLDSTPGIWDTAFYRETLEFARSGSNPKDIFVLPSDKELSLFPATTDAFQAFQSQDRWRGAYASAMGKMVLFGNDRTRMVDCTNEMQS